MGPCEEVASRLEREAISLSARFSLITTSVGYTLHGEKRVEPPKLTRKRFGLEGRVLLIATSVGYPRRDVEQLRSSCH